MYLPVVSSHYIPQPNGPGFVAGPGVSRYGVVKRSLNGVDWKKACIFQFIIINSLTVRHNILKVFLCDIQEK